MKWKMYLKMIDDPKIPIMEIGKFTKNYLPTEIYRYRSFDNFWEENLLEGVVHLSRADKLNDPYDCDFCIDREVYEKYYTNEIRKVNRSDDLVENLIHNMINDVRIKNETSEEYLRMQFKDMKHLYRIASFTEIKDSTLMWSHYSDSHKGFCVEYDFSILNEKQKQCILPIYYTDKVYDITDDIVKKRVNNYMKHTVLKKKEWEYEKEWRFIWPTYKNYDYCFITLIKNVYLGMKFDENEHSGHILKKILKWADEKHIGVYQMNRDLKTFDLLPKKIN